LRRAEDIVPIPQQVTLAGRSVHRVGYGAMQLTDHDGLVVGPDEATAILRAALAQGVDHFDTAEFYGDGALNRLLGREVAREDVVIATKIGARPDPRTRLRPAQRPAELRDQVEANLASLRADRLDLVAVTPAQLGLAWHLHHYERTLLIPGTRSRAHLAENMAVAGIELPHEILTFLKNT
jgi:aryl-alcohol dehydrogenase-like predicted oxidoreductase